MLQNVCNLVSYKCRVNEKEVEMRKFVCGDGKVFWGLDAAIAHANEVYRESGVIIAIEEVL